MLNQTLKYQGQSYKIIHTFIYIDLLVLKSIFALSKAFVLPRNTSTNFFESFSRALACRTLVFVSSSTKVLLSISSFSFMLVLKSTFALSKAFVLPRNIPTNFLLFRFVEHSDD